MPAKITDIITGGVTGQREAWKAWAVLAGAGALYALLAFDQGHLLSLVQGHTAFDTNFIHELVHDARHAAGFPCH